MICSYKKEHMLSNNYLMWNECNYVKKIIKDYFQGASKGNWVIGY